MNEKMLTGAMLVIGIVMVVLILNFCFRKHSRLLLWIEGLVAIVGTLLSIGMGWAKLFMPDGYPNFPVITVVTILLCVGVMFIVFAEKTHRQRKTVGTESQDHIEPTNVYETDNAEAVKTLPLKGKLDTPLAHMIFRKALEDGLMTIESVNGIRQFYSWTKTKVLLSYMCGRIYCGDKSEAEKDSRQVIWKQGKGIFPASELDRLFNQKDLAQQRSNRLEQSVPKEFEIADKLFD